MMNPDIFRQYDIRGRAETDLAAPVPYDLGRALGTWLRRSGIRKLAVGADNRFSSPRLTAELTAGLITTGCEVIDLGTVVTPMLYYAPIHYGLGAGVMVTGSHNPPDENGFKIALGSGTIYGEQIQALRALMEKGDYIEETGRVEAQSVVVPYLAMLKEKIDLGGRNLKVAVDCGNGTGGLFARSVLKGWGCEVVPLFCESDPTFPNHHPDPVKSENLTALRQAVLIHGCDLGVAYDGDADRLGVVDNNGGILWGDTLMALYWREILHRYPGAPAIVEVKCSQALIDEIIRLGGKPTFYKTGHSLIKAKMKELGAPFTGEMSGHMFFADEYYGFDDAFYATGRLLRLLALSGLRLSELIAEIPRYHATAETRVPCADTRKFDVVETMADHFRSRYRIVDVDGARVLFEDGWGLIRASNTQPVLVARCEAASASGLEKICGIMRESLVDCGGVAPFEWEF